MSVSSKYWLNNQSDKVARYDISYAEQFKGRSRCAIVNRQLILPRFIGAIIFVSAWFVLAPIAWAQGSDRGKDEYLASCQPCHGATGKGNGPNAKLLGKHPADLTTLSGSNGGRFPLVRVFEQIDGRLEVALHGSRDMPVWGDRYKRDVITQLPTNSVSDDMANWLARRRILELIEYLLTLQAQPGSPGSN
jgi:mono/diheme cytochrome c family protein